MGLRTSVGHRLAFLITCQTAIALILVMLSEMTLSRLTANYRHMYNFQFLPIVAIGEAMQEAASLKTGSSSPRLDAFYHQYRSKWETATGTTADAIQFRKEVLQAAASDLPRMETEVLEDLQTSLQERDAESIRKDL